MLDRHAKSTTADVSDDNRRLQKLKQLLDECNSKIKTKSLAVEEHAGFTERFAGVLPMSMGKNMKRSREFRRQKDVMEQVTEALEQIHSEMPLLLPAGQMKFLDVKAWNASEITVTEITKDIPSVVYFP